MQKMQGPMQMAMGKVVYWSKNQVVLTFFSNLPPNSSQKAFKTTVEAQVQVLNDQALKDTPFRLVPPGQKPGPMADRAGVQAGDLDGIYTYSSPSRTFQGLPATDIAAFCTVSAQPDTTAAHDKTEGMDDADQTLAIVKLLNDYESSTQDNQSVALNRVHFHAMPNWFWSCVPDVDPTHGCPVTPPFPVENAGRNGRWKTHIHHLPDELHHATGAGVTVFVLDAFPAPEQVANAANGAGRQNRLLQQMAEGMSVGEPFAARPPAISLDYTYEIPAPDQTAVTGKDIYGRLSGIPMPDHGVFAAGLVRDLAPEARIECIRVLNDFGVGDSKSLVKALTSIAARLLPHGDLHNTPVVINLSLVLGPPECDLTRLGLDPRSLRELLQDLYTPLQTLAFYGAIIVASVGNDSDPRDSSMNPSEVRFDARYPAAFGNPRPDHPEFPVLPEIIPVGAVNRRGEPAAYSNYPGPNGIATYGGDLPRPDPWLPMANEHALAHIDPNHPIDALRGVFTSPAYPALSRNDPYPPLMEPPPATQSSYPQYPATETSCWACWAGTSFAAPIISALAARVLQGQSAPFAGYQIHQAITNAASEQTTWTGTVSSGDVPGKVIMATQEWQEE